MDLIEETLRERKVHKKYGLFQRTLPYIVST